MPRHWRILLLFGASVLYLAIGSGIFTIVEGPHEMATRKLLTKTVTTFLEDNPNLTKRNLTQFLREVMTASKEGVFLDSIDNERSAITFRLKNWDWPNAFFFATTVITTIGYGNLAPSTKLGRNICIWFAFLGIPLMAWLLAEVSIQCKQRSQTVAMKIDKYLTGVVRTRRIRKIISIILIGMSAYSLAVLLPAVTYSVTQGWSYNTAHYFCFITLSTIGFGDVVPTFRDSKRRYYQILSSLYLVYGLSVIAIVLNVVQQLQQKQARKLYKYCSACANSTKLREEDDAYATGTEANVQMSVPVTGDNEGQVFPQEELRSSRTPSILQTLPPPSGAEDHKEQMHGCISNTEAEVKSGYGLTLFETSI